MEKYNAEPNIIVSYIVKANKWVHLSVKTYPLPLPNYTKKTSFFAFKIIRNIAATQQKKYNIMHTS